jgi:hypothetical protein
MSKSKATFRAEAAAKLVAFYESTGLAVTGKTCQAAIEEVLRDEAVRLVQEGEAKGITLYSSLYSFNRKYLGAGMIMNDACRILYRKAGLL